MTPIHSSEKVYVSVSQLPNAGRGVFARVPIKKGEIIEQCPIIHIPLHDAESVNASMLVTYLYYLGERKDRLTLPLGFGAIYNHSYQPNAQYQDLTKEGLITFVATSNIEKDEEITVNYNQGQRVDTAPLWFE